MLRSMLNVFAALVVLVSMNMAITTPAFAQKKEGCKAGTTKIPGDGRRCTCSSDGTWSCEKVR